MSNYYVKAKFGNLEQINGETLETGVNAFTSIDELLESERLLLTFFEV